MTKRAIFHPLKQSLWMENNFLEATFTFKKVRVLLHYIIIYYTYDYVSYTYFRVYVEECFFFF